jgi:hypothetical protein
MSHANIYIPNIKRHCSPKQHLNGNEGQLCRLGPKGGIKRSDC